MMIDDWKAGKLPPDDPWAVEALKRGLIQPRKPIETRSISPNPPEPGRNLAEPYLPGTKAFTKRVDDMQLPNPLTTKVEDNPLLMGALGTIGPVRSFTPVSKGVPETILAKEAKELGLDHFGFMGDLKSGHPIYTARDPVTGSNIAPGPGETFEGALNRVRERFGGKK